MVQQQQVSGLTSIDYHPGLSSHIQKHCQTVAGDSSRPGFWTAPPSSFCRCHNSRSCWDEEQPWCDAERKAVTTRAREYYKACMQKCKEQWRDIKEYNEKGRSL